jgi:hypothetical protein
VLANQLMWAKKALFLVTKVAIKLELAELLLKQFCTYQKKSCLQFFPCGHTAPPVSVLGTLVSFVLLLHQVDGVTLKKL